MTTQKRNYGIDDKPVGGSVTLPRTITYKEALADFDSWDSKKLNDFVAQGVVSGLLSRGDGEIQARKLWGQLVADSATYTGNGNNVSPWDILGGYVKNAGAFGKGTWVSQGNNWEVNAMTGERRYVGPQFQTTSQTGVSLTDPDTAAALTTKIFQDLLGRNPMPGEMGSFAAALQAAEQANPVTTVKTDQYDAQGNVIHTDETQSGGLDAAGKEYLLEQKAKANPEYGATQAATTYKNAFEQAIWGGH
jgi:hypothetical protein